MSKKQCRYQEKQKRGVVPVRYSDEYRAWRRNPTPENSARHMVRCAREHGPMPGYKLIDGRLIDVRGKRHVA